MVRRRVYEREILLCVWATVLDTAPVKEKVETPAAKLDTGTSHAGSEALSLLGQSSGGSATTAEPTSGSLEMSNPFKVASAGSGTGAAGGDSAGIIPGKDVSASPVGSASSLDMGSAPPAAGRDVPAQDYTVKQGDSLWKIEKQHLGPGATNADILRGVKEIAKANGMHNINDIIHPGKHLKLPAEHLPARTGHGPGRDQQTEVTPPANKPQPGPGDGPAPTKPEAPKPGGDNPTDPKDKPLQPNERPGTDPAHKFDSPEKQKLLADAEDKLKYKPQDLADFKANMKALEDRSANDHLSPAEVAKTFGQVDRLLEAKGNQPLNEAQRDELAEQVMKQAGYPYSISQGHHSTCALSSIEARTYARNPANAARLVADVGTTGQYTATDGRTFKVDATPHDQSRNPHPPDGSRSHASEIFQVTAANIGLDNYNRSTNPPSDFKYEQHDAVPGSGNSGEELINYGKNPPEVVGHGPGINTANDGHLAEVYQAITGKHDEGIVIGADTYASDRSSGSHLVHSEQDLNNYLAQCKKDGKFPVLVAVDTTSEPFWTDSGRGTAGGSGAGHILNITDYEPGNPPKVTLHNSWGSKAEHGADNPVTTHDLFMAMDAPQFKAGDMQRDASYDRAHGHPDHWKELEVDRLQHAYAFEQNQNNPAGQVANNIQYEHNVKAEMRQAKQDWTAHPDAQDEQKTMKKLDEIIASFDPAAQSRMRAEERSLGLQ